MKRIFLLVLCVALAMTIAAQEKSKGKAKGHDHAAAASSQHHSMAMEKDLKWTAMMVPGFEMAVVNGDPSVAGKQFTIRIRTTQANGAIPPHWHPGDEAITVLKGTFKVGEGDEAKPEATHTLNAGDFAMMPAKVHHFGYAENGCIVQVSGMGPFKVNWVNPKDDPSKKK